MPEEVLTEQRAYYSARAGEYDRWFLREGRHDRGADATARWFAEVDEVRAALAAVPLDGLDVLELAPGTGIWTEQLVGRAASLTLVDASPEMLDECARRLGPAMDDVVVEVADLFSWAPTRTWDAVVFCFWISHVPDELLDRFLRGVASWLRPGGSVFFLDGLPEPSSTAADHVLPEAGSQLMVRRLDDGREFRIVKNFWTAGELVERCSAAGLDVVVSQTASYFQLGVGRKS